MATPRAAPRHVDAARAHGDIEDRDFRLRARHEADRDGVVVERADDPQVRLLLQQPGNALAHQDVVGDEHDADHGGHDKPGAAGRFSGR